MRLLLLLLLVGCTRAPVDRPAPPPGPAPSCGDGRVDPFEACDDGPNNSATSPDACRPGCFLPACGDGVQDEAEACDDGDLLGGDGCSPSCEAETGALEAEPNDIPNTAGPITPGVWTRGGAPAGDRDCFSFVVPEEGWIDADVAGIEGAACPADTVLSLHDPTGVQLAQGTPGDWACSGIDASTDAGARFMAEGSWRLCVEGLLGVDVPAYDLRVRVHEGSCDLVDLPIDPREDPDGDGVINRCDLDDDGDGAADLDDNCPDHPNTLQIDPFAVDSNGFVHHWLTIGEWQGLESTDECLPSLDPLLGDDAEAAPHLGDVVDDLTWLPWISGGRHINFLWRYGGEAPREVYAVTWVRSPVERAATLALGIDDGFFAWLNGDLVDEISTCQGANVDQFQSEVTLQAGWNRLMIKVRDQGGGWGLIARFLDGEAPITDLEVSMTPDGPWLDDQNDRDGDGIGDICDSTPSG